MKGFKIYTDEPPMKDFLLCFLFFFLFTGAENARAQRLEKVWETTVELKTPESVLYDEKRDVIYVANINGNPSEKDGNGFITVLNPDGSVKDFKWMEHFNAPKGMALFEGKLYVADIDRLVEIDIEHRQILKKYEASDAEFLNDVTASDATGTVFVSDSHGGVIYALREGQLFKWLEGSPLERPNGLLAEDGRIFIGDKDIFQVEINSKKIVPVVKNTGGVDGLEKNNAGEFVFSNWGGRIFVHKDGHTVKIHDSAEQKINTADIDFALKYNWVLVPTFFDDRVIAYEYVD